MKSNHSKKNCSFFFSFILALGFSATIPTNIQAEKGQIGLGYDEGIAVRYFFSDVMGVQANLAMDYLGGHDENQSVNTNELPPEYNFGFGIGLLYSLFTSNYVFLDALGQIAYAHDGERSDENIGDRDIYFLRLALAPEFLLGDHLGIGMRLGFETAFLGETREIEQGNPVDKDNARTNIRFFGPENPFDGPVLGLSVYVYFGG